MVYFLFVIGFFLLIKGADFLVEGSSSMARRLGIPSIIVGLTVVAFGTSAPEMIVNVISALNGTTDIALGNVIGSNIINLLLILGLTALIYPLAVPATTVWKDIPYSFLAALVIFILGGDSLIDHARNSVLTRSDGIILLLFFLLFILYMVEMALNNQVATNSEQQDQGRANTWPKIVGYIIIGLVCLFFGGKWVVEGAILIARKFGISDYLISATIVACGTSLPELFTSVIAALKKEPDLSVGNVVGSNIFNGLLVLGITPLIKNVPVAPGIDHDLIFLMILTLFLFLFMFIGERNKMNRWQGGFFVFLYVMYLIYAIMRG